VYSEIARAPAFHALGRFDSPPRKAVLLAAMGNLRHLLARGSVLGALLLALACTFAATPAVAADKQINALEMKAREAFAASRYDEALQTFAKLYAETLHPVYLRNIGRCHQKMREPQKAIDAFQDYLAKTKTGKDKITPDERTEIEGYIKDMEALRDSMAAAPPPAAPVTPIGTPAPAPNPALASPVPQPGPATSAPPAGVLTAPPPPAASPVYTRWWFWTGVVVVVAATVGTVFLVTRDSRQECPSYVTKCM
jgi:hypothetical protein